MRRRSLLAALAGSTVGVAGCTGPSRDREPFGVPTTTTSTTTTTVDLGAETTTPSEVGDPGVTPQVEVTLPEGITSTAVTAAGEPRKLVLTSNPFGKQRPEMVFRAGFVKTATPTAPARVWMAIENKAPRAHTFTFGPTPPFSGYDGRSQSDPAASPGAYLLPADDRRYADYGSEIPDRPFRGCWRVTEPPEHPDLRTEVTMAPGESVVGEYVLLWPEGMGSCVPAQPLVFHSGLEGTSVVLSAWRPDDAQPGPSRFEEPLPALPRADRTAWFHETPGGLYLAPHAERLSGPSATLSATLHNYSTDNVTINPGLWTLYKRHETGWKRIAPWQTSASVLLLFPGTSHEIAIRIDNDADGVDGNRVLSGLGPGTYALQHGVAPIPVESQPGPLVIRGRGVETPTSTETEAVAFAAAFDLDARPVEIRPTDAIERTVRDGETLSVFAGRADPGGETLIVDRASVSDPTVLVEEQVTQTPALRDTLPFLLDDPGIQTVRYQTTQNVREPIQRFADPRASELAFSIRGETFQARTVLS